MSSVSDDAYETSVANLKTHARVALHFHPDRPDARGATVAQSLLECGIYKSQFETLISNGSVSAIQGGARDLWEQKIFGGAYQLAGTVASHRPKYGALNLMLHPDGPAPRFGSCYLLLKPDVSWRATYTYLDSHQDPAQKGTYEELDDIVAALFLEAFTRDFAIGERNLTPTRLVDHLSTKLQEALHDPSGRSAARNLNHYIEAQVHGQVLLSRDADLLVADPSFRNSDTGHVLQAICERYRIGLFWHSGFAIAPADVPLDFRGPTMPSLAERVAVNGRVDAAAIGQAVRDLARSPVAWADRGDHPTVLQELKLLWHVLVKFAAPYESTS
ncbi:MAG: hypothetical protein JWN44_6809 [Myxococcales bacterium]|nr:hypothetical protein [Myxococcales bacterium]